MFNVLQTFNLYIEKGKLSLTVVNLLNVFITDATGNDFCETIMSLRFWQLSAPHAKINTRSRNSTSKFPLSTILPYFTISRIITIPKIFPKNTLALKYNENKRVCVKTMSLMKISHGSWSMNIYWLINNRPEKSTVSTRNLWSLQLQHWIEPQQNKIYLP